jgi:hypothetical protein
MNADFIVTACNSYASNQATIRELVEALEDIKTDLDMVPRPHMAITYEKGVEILDYVQRSLIGKVDAAIEKATKEGRG